MTFDLSPVDPGKQPPRPLHELLERIGVEDPGSDPTVTGIAADSRSVKPGQAFVAIVGSHSDGHDYLDEAIRRGASAVVLERPPSEHLSVPVLRVEDTRSALAQLAAAWYGHPAEGVRLVGITGTLGKTSVLSLLQDVLSEATVKPGAIGSLGVFLDGVPLGDTGHTAPDPLQLHAGLKQLRDEGCRLVMMEVTSHALTQRRVHGLRFDLGVFTNLVPLEHQDYHGTFADYVEAKTRFFDHLRRGAPLVYNADDLAVSALIRERELAGWGVGTASDAQGRISRVRTSPDGTSFDLVLSPSFAAAAKWNGSLEMRFWIKLLGRSNVMNAALAAAAALLLDVDAGTIREALARIPPPRRRVELIHRGRFQILDDTAGHPESISALVGVVEALQARKLHLAYAVRGMRGAEINRQVAAALATWGAAASPATLVVTRSEDAADERNVVSDDELEAFRSGLADGGMSFIEKARLDEAVTMVLDRAEAGDLVLLLGAQGMDEGADIARDWLARRGVAAG